MWAIAFIFFDDLGLCFQNIACLMDTYFTCLTDFLPAYSII